MTVDSSVNNENILERLPLNKREDFFRNEFK